MSAVELDQFFHEGKADAQPTVGARGGIVGLVEALEEMGKRLRPDARPGVRDAQDGLNLPRARRNGFGR